MFISGIYYPQGMRSNIPFTVWTAHATVEFPDGNQVTLPVEGKDDWSEGFNSARRFVNDPEKILEFSTRGSDQAPILVTVHRNGRCTVRGMVMAMANSTEE